LLLSLGLLSAMAVAPEVDIRRDMTVAAIERVMPSVVNIRTSKLVRRNDPYETIFRKFYGLDDASQPKEEINSIGSGVIIDEVGDEVYILTNLHVLRRADRVQVQLWDGREYEAQPLLWNNQKDLALLKIVRRPGDKPAQPITMAKDDDLLLGETVISVGNPFGLGGSVTRGILSSKNRRTTSGSAKLEYPDWLQTDADINPGNSGGPLINIRGELIGINVAVYSTDEGKGTGFAIPVKQISSALSDFFTLEWTAKLWLGARFRGAPEPLTVREVQQNSPADRAGLRIGQQVVEVNGKAVTSLAAFNQLMAAAPDRKVRITVLENGARRVLNVELVTMADLSRQMIRSRLGVTAQPLSEAQAAAYQMKPGEGLVVGEVEKTSPAEKAQIQSGMVLTKVDGIGVGDLVNVTNILGNKKPGERVQLTVLVVNRYGSGVAQVLSGQVDVAVR
jgi:S1-C subfamily serine protease